MTNDNSLLAHLAGRFTDQTEDIATEALGYILSRSAAARNALQDMLRAGGADVGQLAYVRTQVSGEKGGRPDLVGFDDHDAERVLIEVKFWAGLTENQPNTYLDWLPKDKPSALLFVAPEIRSERLWAELLRTVKLSSRATSKDKSLAISGGKRRLMLTSWETLISKIRATSPDVVDDLRQLEGLCQEEGANPLLPLRSEQLGPEFARLMLSLTELINEATQMGESQNLLSTAGLRAAPGTGGFGKNMLLAGASAWLGVNYGLWAEDGDTPLWLVFLSKRHKNSTVGIQEVRRKLEQLKLKQPPDVISLYDGRECVPIYLPVGDEYSVVRDAVVERLEEIAQLLRAKRRGRPPKSS